jgi:hypothetical protein
MGFFLQEHEILKLPPQKLAMFLQASESPTVSWREEEYVAILQHQLNVPLVTMHPKICSNLTLRQVFETDAPLECLLACKDWAKFNLRIEDPPVPDAVSMILYYAAISKARLAYQQHLTSLDDAALIRGVQWCLDQKWLPSLLLDLFRRTNLKISSFS